MIKTSINTLKQHPRLVKLTLALLLAGAMCAWGVLQYQNHQRIQRLMHSTLQQMIFVEGGTFMMGDVGYLDEKGRQRHFSPSPKVFPVHQVTLTSYSMNSLETTFRDYDAFTQDTGKELAAKRYRGQAYTSPNHPANSMNWYDAREYCQWLGDHIGYPMDLPTEAQWEYAARSRGMAVAYATNNGKDESGINIRDPEKNDFEMPVGTWPANPLGMYDMTGNVNEWTVDNWHPYSEGPKVDPRHDVFVPDRPKMTRGFGLGGSMGGITLYKRILFPPENTGGGNGIRCVVNHPEVLINASVFN